jgi:hypothetical protein
MRLSRLLIPHVFVSIIQNLLRLATHIGYQLSNNLKSLYLSSLRGRILWASSIRPFVGVELFGDPGPIQSHVRWICLSFDMPSFLLSSWRATIDLKRIMISSYFNF